MKLPEFLSSADPKLTKVILAFANSARQISAEIKTCSTEKAGTKNEFGEEQIALDILADKIIFAELEKSGEVAVAASEEQSEEKVLNPAAEFSTGCDPLDGSSLVDVNLAVGTIFGIWRGKNLLGKTGRDLAATGYAMYGPRTLFVVALDSNPAEFTLQKNGEWKMTAEKMEIGEGKMFSPGNLRTCAENKNYLALLDFWAENGFQLRYSGGMVPDVHQILVKQKGIFSYPGSENFPPKLRLIYECAPLAHLVEAAGGASSNLEKSILDLPIENLEQRVAIVIGSKDEVARCEKFLTI